MDRKASQRLAKMGRELREVRALLARLAEMFYTHARTDLAPDACLPATRRLLARIRRRRLRR